MMLNGLHNRIEHYKDQGMHPLFYYLDGRWHGELDDPGQRRIYTRGETIKQVMLELCLVVERRRAEARRASAA